MFLTLLGIITSVKLRRPLNTLLAKFLTGYPASMDGITIISADTETDSIVTSPFDTE